MTRRTSFLALLFLEFSVAAHAQKVTRGPYLQLLTPDSVIIRWRTDRPSANIVHYGTDLRRWELHASSAGWLTEHVVRVTGLQPDTKYFYAVASTNRVLAGGAMNYFFTTAPAPGARRPLRIWVLGDSGTASKEQKAVREAYEEFTGNRPTDLWLMLGDNAYGSGTDQQYEKAVFKIYDGMLRRAPLWPTLGNHDSRSCNSGTQSGVYFDNFTLPTQAQAGGVASGTEAYYSFDYGNVHFVGLDTSESDCSPGSPMTRWLKTNLAANQRDWTIAYFHHPPYTKGSHDSDARGAESGGRLREVREWLLPVLETGGVDLVLCGHSHSYERSFLLDGHYGKSGTFGQQFQKDAGDGREDGHGAYRKPTPGPAPHEGTVYVVAGSSGKISGGRLDHPAMFTSLNQLGSVVLDIHGHRLDATFLNWRGERPDHFTILKGPQ